MVGGGCDCGCCVLLWSLSALAEVKKYCGFEGQFSFEHVYNPIEWHIEWLIRWRDCEWSFPCRCLINVEMVENLRDFPLGPCLHPTIGQGWVGLVMVI